MNRLELINQKMEKIEKLSKLIHDKVANSTFTAGTLIAQRIFCSEYCQVFLTEADHGSSMNAHCHTESVEYFIVTKGSLWVTIEGEKNQYYRGDVCCVPPDREHMVEVTEPTRYLAILIPPEQVYE